MSSSSSLFSRHWVAEALAADERLDLSILKALVSSSPEFLSGAPEAARERVALRCLQECAAAGGGANGVAAARLRVEASRSCEDVLFDLLRKVGSSGSLEKDKLQLFNHDIQKFIFVKKSTLPKTSFELLRETVPESTFSAPSSPVEPSSTSRHDQDHLPCNISSEHENVDKLRLSTDGAQLHKESSAALTNEMDTGNLQKDPSEPTLHVLQQSISDSKRCDHPQKDVIADVGVSVRLSEKNRVTEGMSMQAAAAPASDGCNMILHGSITGPNHLPEQDLVKNTTVVQQQSCGSKSPPYPPQDSDGNTVHDDGASVQSLRNLTHEGLTTQAIGAPAFDSSNSALRGNISGANHLPEQIIIENTTMIQQPCSSKPHLNSPRYDTGEKVNQTSDDAGASIQPLEKDSSHEGLIAQITGDLASGSCNVAMQGDRSEANHLPEENIVEHTMMVEQHNGNKAHTNSCLVSGGEKVNQTLNDDGMLKNPIHKGLNVQTALASDSCNIALQESISEANHLSEHSIAKNSTIVQQPCGSRSVPNSPRDNGGKKAKQTPNEKGLGTIVPETSREHSSDDICHNIAAANLMFMAEKSRLFSSQVQDTNDSIEGWTEQDLCIKCCKGGQLLKCSGGGCMLAAHESCFGSSVMFDDSGQFYCPVCFYTRATAAYFKARETFSQARKNLAAFLGDNQVIKHHDEQSTGVQPRAANNEDHHLNGSISAERQHNHQAEAVNISDQGKEPDQQIKKQKTNTGSRDASSSGEKIIEKTVDGVASTVQNSEVMQMNKEPVLQKNSEQVRPAGHEQPAENPEAREKTDHGNSSHETRRPSHSRCDTSTAQQDVEANKEDGPTNSRQSEGFDDIEATSSNDSGKRSSPPWHNVRNCKARFQERDAADPCNPEEAFGRQNRHIPSPSKKRKYACPVKRYANPVAPAGRRTNLPWTEEEEAALREAVQKFAPQDDGPIPWTQILDYGRNVFHRTRLPSDLRVKWRNMKKKAGF